MTDHLSPQKRSWNMSLIRSSNTGPERKVRSFLHRAGYRYSLKRKDLPGKPDIVLVSRNTAIFVHGCFWHRHKNCRDATTPKTNTLFWQNKFTGNTKRDKKNKTALTALGWKVITIWECESSNPSALTAKALKIPYAKSLGKTKY